MNTEYLLNLLKTEVGCNSKFIVIQMVWKETRLTSVILFQVLENQSHDSRSQQFRGVSKEKLLILVALEV